MWERRSYYDGCSWRCTVKFSGSIPPWKDDTALGVEWDEPSRGRNSGDLNGIQYFQCRVPDAGSFIKASRMHEKETSLGEAVFCKYIDVTKFDDVEFSRGKSAEVVGVEKLHKAHERIEDLTVISLEAACIKSLVAGPINIAHLSSLQRLDLSNNLIESFDAVLDLIAQLPRLDWLRLNGNRLQFNGTKVCTQVREVEMSNTLVTEEDVSILSASFPEARTLSIAQNRLTRIPRALPAHLETLDISYNSVPEISGFPESLRSLFVSSNEIFQVSDNLKLLNTLDIRGHPLSWDTISRLGESKGIVDLHVTHNSGLENAERAFVIGRCPKLKKLNGTIVTSKERSEAELYTLDAVFRKKHPSLPSNIWYELIMKYGEPAPLPDHSIRARLLTFYIGDSQNPHRIVRNASLVRLFRQISRETQTPVRDLRIKGLNDTADSDQGDFHRTLMVGEVLVDGARLELVSK